jgi:hypothetical protein
VPLPDWSAGDDPTERALDELWKAGRALPIPTAMAVVVVPPPAPPTHTHSVTIRCERGGRSCVCRASYGCRGR